MYIQSGTAFCHNPSILPIEKKMVKGWKPPISGTGKFKNGMIGCNQGTNSGCQNRKKWE
jgi:hypothetical protein